MKKFLFFFLLILLLLGTGITYYRIQMPVPSLEKEKADYIFSAEELFAIYTADEVSSNDRFLDKLIQVSGKVKELSAEGNQLSVILDGGELSGGIICELDPRFRDQLILPKQGQAVTMKGVCSGMLLDVVLVRCVLIA